MDHSTSDHNKKARNNFTNVLSACEETGNQVQKNTNNKKNNQKNVINNNRPIKFDTLMNEKIQLIHVMKNNGKEKHDLEMKILKTQLQKEELQLKVIEKELNLKTKMLEREEETKN